MASIPVQPPRGTPTMLGTIEERNVTFVIDTSGSMYPFLPAVKEHLLEALLTRSFKEKDTMFNLIAFSSTVTPWADKMVKCTPQTVMVAGDWLRRVECSTGSNSLDALVSAFSDPICEGLYLITDGLPDQSPESILREVAKVGHGRPIHCVYLAGASADTPSHDFLESLAVQTAGTFHMISLTQQGDVERVTAVVRADHAGVRRANPVYASNDPPPTTEHTETDTAPKVSHHSGRHETAQQGPSANDEGRVKVCSIKTSVDYNPLPEGDHVGGMAFTRPTKVVQYPGTAWEAYHPPRLVKRLVTHASPPVADRTLVQGMRVLAKRDRDGYYCPGTLTEEISPQRTVLITFDRDPKGPKLQHLLQETGLYDVIAYNDAMRHTITPGDKVLAPWETEGDRMAPGTVVEGIEGRSSGCAADTASLVVSLFNGRTKKVPKQKAVWIPTSLFERIKLEIQMPLTARQFLINDPNYPSVPASYHPNLGSYAEFETISSLGNRRDVPSHFQRLNRSVVSGDAINALIPGTNMTKDELHDKVMRQLAENSSYSLPAMMGQNKYRYHPDKNVSMSDREPDRKIDFREEFSRDEDSMEDSGVSLEKPAEERDDRTDSGCEEDQLVDTGVQTLSLADTGSMTDSRLLYPSTKGDRKHRKDQPMWQYWKQTPQQRSKGAKIGPFRETSLAAPAEPRVQLRYIEPADYAGSLAESTSFDDRDVVKLDKAQKEWQHRQPRPPNLGHSYSNMTDLQATTPLVANYVGFDPPASVLQKDWQSGQLSHPNRAYSNLRDRAGHLGAMTPPIVNHSEFDPIILGDPQREWHYRQPHPPEREDSHQLQDQQEHTTHLQRPSTAGPTFFKSRYETSNPAYFAYGDDMGPPNRSANFERVDHNVKSDRAYLEWLSSHPQPPHIPTRQGPGHPISAKVGTRDMLREAREQAVQDRKRFEKMRREARMKGKEYDALMMREAKEERNRKFRADILQRDAQRQSACEKQVQQTQNAKRAVSSTIREEERGREAQNQAREKGRIDALADKTQKRAQLQDQRNREIDEARAKRKELQEQRNSQRSQRHNTTLAEQNEQQALRDDQMRRAKVERIERFRQKEAEAQAKKDLKIAIHAQKLQEYRAKVLP